MCCTESELTEALHVKQVKYKKRKWKKKKKDKLTMDKWSWQNRPVVREGDPQKQDRNFQTELISGRKSHGRLDTCEGGTEHHHRSPASGKRRRKGNPVPGSIT
jgi:hypothetical protein